MRIIISEPNFTVIEMNIFPIHILCGIEKIMCSLQFINLIKVNYAMLKILLFRN